MTLTFTPKIPKVVGKIVSIDSNTLNQSYLWSMCNVQVCIKNGLAPCNACNNGSTQSVCNFKSKVGLVIHQEEDQSKLHNNVPHSIVEKKFDTSLSNVKNKVILWKLIDKKFLFTIDRFNKYIKIADF